MTAGEQGFLLLTGYLGDPERRPLTVAQFRELTRRARAMEKPSQERELTYEDLITIGCDRKAAQRILHLLGQTEQLQWYLAEGQKRQCLPVTRISEDYPDRLRKCLGMEAPGVLWLKGEISILQKRKIALVGSRELRQDNLAFAWEVGKQAALQGYVLVSGNARGADRVAQESCLEHGGSVICVVADKLEKAAPHTRVLYISEEGYDLDFSAHRALQRNRVIHSLAEKTFVAQSGFQKGGTWDGTKQNLRFGWSNVFCFRDASKATVELEQMGAVLICPEDLQDISGIEPNIQNFIDQWQ